MKHNACIKFYLYNFAKPFSIRVEDHAPLTLAAVTAGSVAVEHDDGSITTLRAGDVALVRGPDPYTMSDEPGRSPVSAQRCSRS